jgi:hypothetical protein
MHVRLLGMPFLGDRGALTAGEVVTIQHDCYKAAAIKLMSLLGMLSVGFTCVLHCAKDVLTAGEVVTMLALLVSDTAAGVAGS